MDNAIKQEMTFTYKYSAAENQEIQEIRKRYLPQSESKLDELKRLDTQVQKAGLIESLCVGIISCLVFGLGMCFAMEVLGSGIAIIVLGVLVGIVGAAGMLVSYPLYLKKQKSTKEALAPTILALADEISNS